MSLNGISTLATKELRQKTKLELAAIDRAASGRRAVYDIAELPTYYSTNTVVNNANPDGLLVGRPWVDINRINLQYYIDPDSTVSYPGTGTSIIDLSTNSNTSTVMLNGVGFSTSTTYNAWTFDGIDDYIDTNQSLAAENSFTINAWVKITDATNYSMIVSKETTAGYPWNYRMYTSITTGKLTADIAVSVGNIASVNGVTTATDNTWHMATFVRNTNTDTLSVYLDGIVDAVGTDTTVGSIANSQEVWIGRSAFTQGGISPTGSYPYKGSIGEVMIYNRAMNADEVAITFRATRSRYGV